MKLRDLIGCNTSLPGATDMVHFRCGTPGQLCHRCTQLLTLADKYEPGTPPWDPELHGADWLAAYASDQNRDPHAQQRLNDTAQLLRESLELLSGVRQQLALVDLGTGTVLEGVTAARAGVAQLHMLIAKMNTAKSVFSTLGVTSVGDGLIDIADRVVEEVERLRVVDDTGLSKRCTALIGDIEAAGPWKFTSAYTLEEAVNCLIVDFVKDKRALIAVEKAINNA